MEATELQEVIRNAAITAAIPLFKDVAWARENVSRNVAYGYVAGRILRAGEEAQVANNIIFDETPLMRDKNKRLAMRYALQAAKLALSEFNDCPQASIYVGVEWAIKWAARK